MTWCFELGVQLVKEGHKRSDPALKLLHASLSLFSLLTVSVPAQAAPKNANLGYDSYTGGAGRICERDFWG